MANFKLALEDVLELEGDYSNDPYDRGGETRWGITAKVLDYFFPGTKITEMTRAQMERIYKKGYWDILKLDSVISQGIASELFEQAVNFGPYHATYHAQRALNLLGGDLVLDGAMGPVTMTALNEYPHKDALLKCLNGLQFLRYVEITTNNPSQERFFRGWLRRVV